ncbi:MAG TPA: tetratricopeptide repeat protein [Terriglobales bacterium]|nr:tetratricopeptide repeat protein [Terriglobales bacterium]
MAVGRAVAALLVLLLVCGATFAPAQTPKKSSSQKTARKRVQVADVSERILRAEAAIDKQDFPAAERLLLEEAASSPKDYRVWFDLGLVYTATDRRKEAIDAYRKAVDAQPEVAESNLNLGVLLAAEGNPEAAIFLHSAARLKQAPQSAEALAHAWMSLGRALEKDRPAEAVAAYREASLLRPRDPEPVISAAAALERQGDLPAAELEFRKALELDPKSSDALGGLINVYIRGQRLPEAEQTLRHYLNVDSGNATARLQLSRVLVAQGRTDDAAAELQQMLQAVPDDPAVQRELADLYLKAGRYSDAEGLYRALVQKQPNDAALRHALGVILRHEQKYAEAETELVRALSLKPDLAEAYGDLAVTANLNKNYALVLKVLDARVRYLPDTAATVFLRATAFDSLRDYKQAAENYRRFLAMAAGKYPEEEWKARHRLKAIEPQ